MRAIGVSHTQLAKTSFDEIFDLTSGVYCYLIASSTLKTMVMLRTFSWLD